jgi:hypothetical protein
VADDHAAAVQVERGRAGLAGDVLAGVPAQPDRRAVGGGQLVVVDRDVLRERLGGVGVLEDALQRGAAGGDVPTGGGVLPAVAAAMGARASATWGSRVKDMTVLLCGRAACSG